MAYPFSLHLHRFAIWTAARAVNRNFINTKCIQEAIEEINLQQELFQLSTDVNLNQDTFDAFHRKAAMALIESLQIKLGVNGKKASYGRAAKIIAMYIKTCYILIHPNSNLSKIAHPPIDSILLKNLAGKHKALKVGDLRWTYLDEIAYFELIATLRKNFSLNYFWELEEYWLPG